MHKKVDGMITTHQKERKEMPKKPKEKKDHPPRSSRPQAYKSIVVDKEQMKARQEERTKKTKALVFELGRIYPYLSETIIEAVVRHGLTLTEVRALKRLNAQAKSVYNWEQ